MLLERRRRCEPYIFLPIGELWPRRRRKSFHGRGRCRRLIRCYRAVDRKGASPTDNHAILVNALCPDWRTIAGSRGGLCFAAADFGGRSNVSAAEHSTNDSRARVNQRGTAGRGGTAGD